MLSVTLICGVHTTVAPATTYSTLCTAVALLTSANALKEIVAVPSTPVACKVIAPEVSGVTNVDTTPLASVCRVQVAAPQAANCTPPAVAAKVTASPTTGVTPSPSKTCTAKGTAACCARATVPEGAVSRLSVVTGAA